MASDLPGPRQISDKDLRRIMGHQGDPPRQTEALFEELEQALGLLSTLAPRVEIDGIHPLRMARQIEQSVTEQIDHLTHTINVQALQIETLREAIMAGKHQGKAPLRTRIAESWRVLRGIVNVDAIRVLAYRQAERADREMNAHSATLQRVAEEQKATGLELQRLREEHRHALDLAQKACSQRDEAKALLDEAVDAKSRALDAADRHAREHMARADALDRKLALMQQDAKLELQVWYNPFGVPGMRWQRERNYPPGTVLERRNAADQPIARSTDGGKTWQEVTETIVVPDEQG